MHVVRFGCKHVKIAFILNKCRDLKKEEIVIIQIQNNNLSPQPTGTPHVLLSIANFHL
jgi:hypothetical protein